MISSTVEYLPGFGGVLVVPAAAAPSSGVLVLHGGAGLGEHERERAQRLAELGHVALAPDLFGERFRDRAHGMAVITGLVEDPARLRGRLNAALAWLRAQPSVAPERTAVIGFCFGGLAALELARSGADLRAAVAFHGGLQARLPARPDQVRCRVLVCTGAADPFVTREARAGFEDEMTSANVDWQMHVYGGAQHGFTEPGTRPGSAYHAAADRQSWQSMRALFEQVLAA